MVDAPKQYHLTHGGLAGHVFRRCVHIGFLLVFPWFNYHFGSTVGGWLGVSWSMCLWIVCALVILLEIIRIKFKWVIFGQRQHEAHHVSSVVWALTAAILVVQCAQPYIAYAILWSCALVDPLMGELRQAKLKSALVFIVGLLVALTIWLLVLNYFKISLWHALYFALLVVLAEWPNLSWIDDNALMMWVPLVVSLF